MRKPVATEQTPVAIPRVGEGKRGASGHIGYLLRQAFAVHRAEMERALADFGVTSPQFAVLTMLAAYPGASSADVARLVMQTPQTVSVIMANLERAGLIARRDHAVHGRIQHVDLTSAGTRLLARCRQRVQEIEQGLVAGLDAREERAVRRWLVLVAMRSGEPV